MKSARVIWLALLLLPLGLLLSACGSSASEIPTYNGAIKFEPSDEVMKSFKDGLKGVKEANLATYAIKDDVSAVRAFYEGQFKDSGWTKEDLKDSVKQVEQSGGWALAYEKGGKIVTLTMTPASIAGVRFPAANNSNVLIVVSGAR